MRMALCLLTRNARSALALCCPLLAAFIMPAVAKGDAPADGALLAQNAQAVLRANCYRCHGQDGASEGGFNFVLNLEKLSQTHVKPKAPADSLLFLRLTAADDSVMPPLEEQPRPTATDIATIKAWIEAGAASIPAANSRDFVTNDQVVQYVLADLRTARQRSQGLLRYFTLTHLYNAGVSDDELRTYRNAFVKLINSLSWNTDLGQVVKQTPLARSAAGQAAAFSEDGSLVAAGDLYTVRLWEVKTGKELPRLEDNEIQWCAAFTPDGARLVTGGTGKVNVWDVGKQRKIHSLETAGSGYVQCLAVSPDNLHIAAIPSAARQDLQVFRIPHAER